MRGKFNIYDIYIVNMKTNMRTNMRTNTKTRTKQGGKVLASGGFGCVFTPALKCEGAAHREKGKVSKLMTERHAISEYKEINAFKTRLNQRLRFRMLAATTDLFLANLSTLLCGESLRQRLFHCRKKRVLDRLFGRRWHKVY